MDKDEAKREDNKLRYRIFIDSLIERMGGECTECQSTQSLEFDHVDWRTKAFTITTNWYIKDRELFESELAKCQLLCKPCHRTKTVKDLSEQEREQFTHGTSYAWMKRKCSCGECSDAKRIWYDERNARRRVSTEASAPYNQPAEHGTSKMYKRGCKCDECRAANARKAAEAYALKRAS